MKKICITGASGTGKSTLSLALQARGIVSFDIEAIDNLCYWINKETGEKASFTHGAGTAWLQAHDWTCDLDHLKKELAKHENCIAAVGVTSNQKDILSLFDQTFLLRCTPATMVHRLNTRTTNDWGKDPDEQRAVLNWHKIFEDDMLARGAIPISSEGSIEETLERLLSSLNPQLLAHPVIPSA